MLIGVAEAGRVGLDQDLLSPRIIEIHFLDLPFLVCSIEHRGAGLHRCVLPASSDQVGLSAQ